MKTRLQIIVLAILCLPSAAFAACPDTSFTFKNDALATVTMCAGSVAGGMFSQTQIINSAGAVIGLSGAPLRIDPTGTTTQPITGTVSVSGTTAVSGTVAVSGTTAVSGTVSVGGTAAVSGSVSPVAVATGGFSKLLVNNLSTTVTTVKSSAGKLSFLYCYNPNVAVAYVQIFDVSGTVTLGTTSPGGGSYAIPPTNTAGFQSDVGVDFTAAIKVAATTTATGSTAPSVALDCNAWFK